LKTYIESTKFVLKNFKFRF